MKRIIYMMLAFLVVLIACSKEDQIIIPEQQGDGFVQFPMNGEFTSYAMDDGQFISYGNEGELNFMIPKNHVFTGSCSQIGILAVLENSQLTFNEVNYDVAENLFILTGEGTFIGSDGDQIQYSITNKIDPSIQGFTGYLNINQGTGRFKDAKGGMNINGNYNFETGSGSWAMDGFIWMKVDQE